MELLKKIIEGSSIIINENKYKVLGKAYYVTQSDTETVYAKILLDNHYVLVISPLENVAYFGKNMGRILEFDLYESSVIFAQKEYIKVNNDYQIMTELVFGSPLEVEGEVTFWDYEADNNLISVAIVSRTNERADVVAEYIELTDIQVVLE